MPVDEKTMSATSASQSTESSSAFLKRPLRRLEKVTCRAAALSIRFISRLSRAIASDRPIEGRGAGLAARVGRRREHSEPRLRCDGDGERDAKGEERKGGRGSVEWRRRSGGWPGCDTDGDGLLLLVVQLALLLLAKPLMRTEPSKSPRKATRGLA